MIFDFTCNDFLEYLEYDAEVEGQLGAVSMIEKILGNAEAFSLRLAFLDSLGENIPDIDNHNFQPVKSDINIALIIKEGLVNAFLDGKLEFSDIVRLSHSAEGLREFNDLLLTTEPEHAAECWRDAFALPFEATSPGSHALSVTERQGPLLDRITDLVAAFITPLLLPPKKVPLGTMGTEALDADIKAAELQWLIDPVKISSSLKALESFKPGEDNDRIGEIWQKIPWQEIKSTIYVGMTLGDFLKMAWALTVKNINNDEVEYLLDYIKMGSGSLAGDVLNLELLELIFLSRSL